MASVICRASGRASVVAPRTWLLSARLSSHVATAVHGHHEVQHDNHGHGAYVANYREHIGNREVVGYGWAGEPAYQDSIVWPYPAIRFQRPDAISPALLKKEEGDWKNLSIDDKKALYRYSHCETFSEMFAPTGNWKSILGIMCSIMAVALWASMGLKKIYPKLPETFDDEHRLAQLKRMIDLRVGAVDGLSSKWDYDKGRWKKD